MKKNRLMGLALAGVLALSVAGCGGGDEAKPAGSAPADASADYKVQMVTDMGGVNDQSFNQLAWEGLQQLNKDTGIEVGYTESKQESDYATNLDKAVDDGAQTVWGIGFAMAEAIQNTAKTNPDVHFAIIDNAYPEADLLDNLTGVTFKTQEPSFVAGYIAAMTTQTGKVGFIGGMKSDVLETFDWGYQAGVAYANATEGTNVEVVSQYIETFTDAAKGKAAGQKMYSDGCDIVFACAGNAGNGVIEAAQSMGATPLQIITKVMVPESMPSLVANITIAATTIMGYGAMAGIIGGGGLGKIAINYGYYRFNVVLEFFATALLVVLVQILQTAGTKLAVKCDKRIQK